MGCVSEAPDQPEQQDDSAAGAPVVPDAPQTGDQAVDEAVRLLAEAMSGPLEEQADAYDLAHRTLQDRLADVEG